MWRHALMGEQPQHPAMVAARRDAADEVRVGVGDDAGQHRDPEVRSGSPDSSPPDVAWCIATWLLEPELAAARPE